MLKRNGYSLAELLIVVAIIGFFALSSIPAFNGLRRRSAIRAAAASMRTIFHLARSRAIARGQNSGLKFTQVGSEWQYAIYDDGDGDGVRSDDIARGVDKIGRPSQPVFPGTKRLVTIGLLRTAIKDPDGDALLPTASPVQFNRSTICSFSPLGQSTPGTVYLTTATNDLWAVRVYGASAKIRSLRYDSGVKKWVQ